MKKKWQVPHLEVLDIKMTMAGPGIKIVDDYQDDPDHEEADHYS
ncbi:MAG: paeninodin family lasso peptide [Heyndrickxia sp.]